MSSVVPDAKATGPSKVGRKAAGSRASLSRAFVLVRKNATSAALPHDAARFHFGTGRIGKVATCCGNVAGSRSTQGGGRGRRLGTVVGICGRNLWSESVVGICGRNLWSKSVVGADVLGGPPSARDVRQSDLMRRAGRARGTRAPPRGTAPPQDEISPRNNLEIHCGLPRGSLGGLRRGEKQKRTRPRFLPSLACQDLHSRAKRAWRATRPSAWRA